MVLISSFRPFPRCTPAIAENQIRAFRSWLTVAERIVYVGDSCEELSSCLTEFVPFRGKPPIRILARIATQFPEWSALVNADIVLSPKTRHIESVMNQTNLMCATSYRVDLQTGYRIDMGLDAFFAKQEVWSGVASRIPDGFKIGQGQWDNWLLGYFVQNYGRRCADLTPIKLLAHPRHEDRDNPNWQVPQDKYLKHCWPTTIINHM